MISTIIPQGYFIDYVKEQPDYLHCFCGPHDITGADCPNCTKPLLRFFTFDTHDPRLRVMQNIAPQLHLLNCWTCNLAQRPFFYRCLPDGAVQLIEYGHDGIEVDFPYENYPRHFPGRFAMLTPIMPDQQGVILQLNQEEISPYRDDQTEALAIPTHQLGGEPYLIQPWECIELTCPECKKYMPFFASVGDRCLLPQGFVDNDYVQMCFSLCLTCSIIGAVVMCD